MGDHRRLPTGEPPHRLGRRLDVDDHRVDGAVDRREAGGVLLGPLEREDVVRGPDHRCDATEPADQGGVEAAVELRLEVDHLRPQPPRDELCRERGSGPEGRAPQVEAGRDPRRASPTVAREAPAHRGRGRVRRERAAAEHLGGRSALGECADEEVGVRGDAAALRRVDQQHSHPRGRARPAPQQTEQAEALGLRQARHQERDEVGGHDREAGADHLE